MTTAYDRVAYPSTVHALTHPDRLAVIAHLAGMTPAPMDRARVLEIGGGDCLSLLAFAAAYPNSRCAGFDLAPSAIAHGQRLAGDSLPNVELAVEDIMNARARYAAGSFDYVVAHGVYAWVPAPVREALMALVGHVLAPQGVALISYNALPGGHIRRVLREMVLGAIDGITGADERIEAARATLHHFGQPIAGDEPMLQAMRHQARTMLERPSSVLFHDELGDCFEPQSLSQVAQAARSHGLAFLSDAGPNRVYDGFLTNDALDVADPDGHVLKMAQLADYMDLRWFRATLLVRAETKVSRKVDEARLDGLWVSAPALKALDGNGFEHREGVFEIPDDELAQHLRELAAHPLLRIPATAIAKTARQCAIVLALYRSWQIHLHTGPAPYGTAPGARPMAGRWIRELIGRGHHDLVTLSHRQIRIEQRELLDLLLAADGTRTWDDFAHLDCGLPANMIHDALREAVRQGLMAA